MKRDDVMRLRISYVVAALAALSIGFLLGTPRVRAQTADEISNLNTINIGVPINLPPCGLLNGKYSATENTAYCPKDKASSRTDDLKSLRIGVPLPELPVF